MSRTYHTLLTTLLCATVCAMEQDPHKALSDIEQKEPDLSFAFIKRAITPLPGLQVIPSLRELSIKKIDIPYHAKIIEPFIKNLIDQYNIILLQQPQDQPISLNTIKTALQPTCMQVTNDINASGIALDILPPDLTSALLFYVLQRHVTEIKDNDTEQTEASLPSWSEAITTMLAGVLEPLHPLVAKMLQKAFDNDFKYIDILRKFNNFSNPKVCKNIRDYLSSINHQKDKVFAFIKPIQMLPEVYTQQVDLTPKKFEDQDHALGFIYLTSLNKPIRNIYAQQNAQDLKNQNSITKILEAVLTFLFEISEDYSGLSLHLEEDQKDYTFLEIIDASLFNLSLDYNWNDIEALCNIIPQIFNGIKNDPSVLNELIQKIKNKNRLCLEKIDKIFACINNSATPDRYTEVTKEMTLAQTRHKEFDTFFNSIIPTILDHASQDSKDSNYTEQLEQLKLD